MAIKRHYQIYGLAVCGAFIAWIGLVTGATHTETIWLSSLDLSKAKVTDSIRPSIDKTIDGKTLAINKQTYDRGICVNGYTVFYVRLNGGSDRFSAVAGVDDESLVSPAPTPVPPTLPGARARAPGAGEPIAPIHERADSGRRKQGAL